MDVPRRTSLSQHWNLSEKGYKPILQLPVVQIYRLLDKKDMQLQQVRKLG